MFVLIAVMLMILVAAAFVVVYVAFPHRDQEVPGAPWLGEAMKRGVEAMPPTLEDESGSEAALMETFETHR